MRRTDADALRPSLILLDLYLPIRNGLDVLAELKSDTEFLSIPIVVLTTSQAPSDIQQCYSLHANAYIIKPADFDGYADVIKQVATSFLGLISLPPQRWARLVVDTLAVLAGRLTSSAPPTSPGDRCSRGRRG